MKLSRFVFHVCDGDTHLLYNTINDSVVRLSDEEFLGGRISGGVRDILCTMGFMVSEDVDESASFLDAVMKRMTEKKDGCIHILPTTSCNFRCAYCYQAGIDRGHSFNEKDVGPVISDLIYWIDNNGIKSINVILHGGEPTLNLGFSQLFLRQFIPQLEERGVSYSTQIVTNGYMLEEEWIDLLKRYRCNRIQFTLDGLKDIHDTRRFLADGTGTFDKIIQNMHLALDEECVDKLTIRMNFDSSNYLELKNLLDFLSSEFGPEKISLSFGQVTPTLIATTGGMIDSVHMPNIYFSLYKHATDLGFEMSHIYVHDGYCSAKMPLSVIVSPDGYYYKCLSTVGRAGLETGQIGHGIPVNSMTAIDLYRRCLDTDCPWVPICHTGCRFDSLLKNGTLYDLCCHKEMMNELNTLILGYFSSHS